MRHIRIKNKSVPLYGRRGHVVLPDKHGIVKKGKGFGGGIEIMLSEPELSQHGLRNITEGMDNIGMGMKKKKHLKPLHFRI
jgi:hypothetical protein